MNRISNKIINLTHSKNIFLVLGAIFVLTAFTFLVLPGSSSHKTNFATKKVLSAKVSITKTATPSPAPTFFYASPTPTQTPSNTPTPVPSNPTSTSSQSQSSAQTVNLQIIEPDGTQNFSVNLKSGNNICDTLEEAKNEGKIKSVTLDDSYQSSLHSAYVKEINGYQNNWTFSVNGASPQGCSLYNPKPGDNITWKFG